MKARALLLALTLCLLTILSSQPVDKMALPKVTASQMTDFPWLMFHHDLLRTGTTQASGPTTSTLVWTHKTNSQVWASPAVSDGLVFIPSSDGTLYVLDEFTGQLKWSFSTGASIIASPAVSSGKVYIASRTPGVVYALNEATGGQVWTYTKAGYSITSSPAVADGRVFFGDWCQGGLCNPPGHFVALNATTGINVWPTATTPSASVVSSPSLDSGHVFIGEDDGTVVCLDEQSGATIWSTVPSGTTFVRTSPAIMSGRVYVGTGTNFVALNEASGATAWSFNTGGANASSAAAYNGIVYFGTGRGRVYALNGTSGAMIWRSTTVSAAFSSSPALSLGSRTLYIGANDRNLYALDASTGATIWTYLTGGAIYSSPAVADGRVFFGSFDNSIYSLGTRLPQLQVSIAANPTNILSLGTTMLVVTVTNGTSPVSGANVTLSFSSGGSFTPIQGGGSGVYTSNYTATTVASQTTVTLTAMAVKNGYIDGTGQTTITVMPFPPLSVAALPDVSTITPGGDVLLKIQVFNNTQGIAGANVTMSSSQGGSFSTPSDLKNGTYLVIFNAPLQSGQPTITISAFKTGFSEGQKQVTLTVSGIPNIISGKVAGVPLLGILLGILVLVLVLMLALVALTRRNKSNGFYIGSSTA